MLVQDVLPEKGDMARLKGVMGEYKVEANREVEGETGGGASL